MHIHHYSQVVCLALLLLSGHNAASADSTTAVTGPQFVRPAPGNEGTLLALPDGRLKSFYMIMGQQIESITSIDNGLSWSEPAIELPMNGLKSHHACRVLLDRDGEFHVWFVVHVDRQQEPNRARRAIDVWHAKTTAGKWGEPHRAFVGYVGALRGAVQLSSGRIVVPISVWNDSEVVPRGGEPGTGNHFVTTIYSDDGGESWITSSALLTAPVFANYNGSNYGAVEPSVVQLIDGRLWMLMRTQTGVLYQSYSSDGIKWSPAQPTQFYSSNSPTAILRLNDGKLLLLWNNAQMPARVGKQMLYAGRDALHAAISADDGQTWRGFREVYRDPVRHRTPPAAGDRGTAYPTVAQAKSGEIVVSTGQGEAHRGIVRFSPDWLLETSATEDFGQGIEQLSAFTEFGKPYRIFLDRKAGPEVISVADVGDVGVKRALHVRRLAANEPADAALWNFPAGKAGTLRFELRVAAGSRGGAIALADRFFNPGDPQALAEAMFVWSVDPQSITPDASSNAWHKIEMQWNLANKDCKVLVDGKLISTLSLQHSCPHGINYVRFQSTSAEADPQGMQVGNLSVLVDP